MGTPGTPADGGVLKCGYLRKQKHGHRRFFVLRAATERAPARLEYYESEKKWRSKSQSQSQQSQSGSQSSSAAGPRRALPLDSCLCVNKRADAKHRHLVALYTKDEYFAVAADSEPEQDSWFSVLTEAVNEGKSRGALPACTSSLVGFEEASAPPAGASSSSFREVWQVTLKGRGLGGQRNLAGVTRLCLASRTLSFVKLNSSTAAVTLQLLNIRRCGHSDSFFFMEVGRSAVTGPGEFWMQAEDLVVAQNIHETILEAMRALKELAEFRPRSKSQSASTNPISVPQRRHHHLHQLPPSQTGLPRRSRTDSAAASFAPGRVRTASEGDGGVSRPVSLSVSGSPTSPPHAGPPLSRSHTVSSGRTCRLLEANLQHSRSMPVSRSPPAGCSPLSTSPRGGPDRAGRPFSCSASMSGSLGDAGFPLCDEYGSSPGERCLSLARSDTPDSLSSTPPSRDHGDPAGYTVMEAGSALDKHYRKRTHSLTTPRQQRVVAPLSSASLDEYTLMRMARGHQGSASPRVCYPEDYGDVEIGSSRSSSSNLADEGYMPMTPGVAPPSGRADNYVAMSPSCVSAPKQIVNPRVHPQAGGGGYKTSSPCSSSLEDAGYMRMWCGKSSMESPDRQGDYMNMSPGKTPPDCYLGLLAGEPAPARAACPAGPPTKPQTDDSQYVLMSPQSSRQRGESDYYAVMQPGGGPSSHLSPSAPAPARHARAETLSYRGRLGRPNRLSLDTLKTLPSMTEHPPSGEPRSPGEYINIDFSRASPPSLSTGSPSSSLGSAGGPVRMSLSEYINLELGARSPKGAGPPAERLDPLPESCSRPEGGDAPGLSDDYTEMTFGMTSSPPQLVPHNTTSPSTRERPAPLEDPGVPPPIGVFRLGASSSPTVDPDCSAKVIRANPQGRRRHSSETFSSTATVTPVFPSFARGEAVRRPSSVENISSRSSEGSDEEYGSPLSRQPPLGYAGGLNYIALNLLENREVEKCGDLVGFKPASSCKGGINGLHQPYVCLGFKEAATTAKD
ncbi:insulin receptor substrate 2-like isoform X2 [Cololabis saira]|uniref:insulin receptor substrate 2-like isoform X2 n=1 Tax=Cololabis saira TaxID=129043 RepID=UPI002AD32BEF|nr:insulin receptor substrate 2-like isoform X2 [Cololabis saira]